MRWDYPVHNFFDEDRSEAYTKAKAYTKALSRQEAFYRVSEDDRRPLLVLRECAWCNGTDDALLSNPTGNERTFIMLRWFHSVKLPMDVLHEDHIFRNLFDEEHPPHVFLATWDGKKVIPFPGDASTKEMQDGLFKLIKSEYKGDARKVVKEIELLVAQYDMLDEHIARLEVNYENEVEFTGEDSRKSKKLKAELDDQVKELAALRAQEIKHSALKLKKPNAKPLPLKESAPASASAKK